MSIEEIRLTPDLLRNLQKNQFEMLVELDRICRQEHIRYSLDGGTLLGAVRDGHIIPWDDDIDVVMLRKEYEKFFIACKMYLDHQKFFLQEHRTDSECNIGYARIRRENTIYARLGHEHLNYHGGIFIDIFILDGVPDHTLIRPFHRAWCCILRKILWSKGGWKIHSGHWQRKMYWILSGIPYDWTFHQINRLAEIGNKKPRRLVRHLTHPYPNAKVCPYGVPADIFFEYAEIQLEGKYFLCVKDYKRYLQLLYGNYMQLPPLEERKPHIHLTRLEFSSF